MPYTVLLIHRPQLTFDGRPGGKVNIAGNTAWANAGEAIVIAGTRL